MIAYVHADNLLQYYTAWIANSVTGIPRICILQVAWFFPRSQFDS